MFNISQFGARLKQERKSMDLSMDELGEKLNITRQTLSNWEKGESSPTVGDLLNMCEIFHCDFGYLVGEYDCRTRESTDIQKLTGLSEDAIKEIISWFHLYGSESTDLLSNLMVSDEFQDALMSALCAMECSKAHDVVPFLASDFTLPPKLRRRKNKDGMAFYLQEAQTNFRKAIEKIINKNRTYGGRNSNGKHPRAKRS